MPEVLELHLKSLLDQPWLRPVMAVLAQARGQGMPVTMIARVAAALDTRLPTPTLSDIRGALGEAKFFLRQATDTDRTTVYRLFHQGLVDHLDAHPFDSARDTIDPDVLLGALLAPLGPARSRDWAAAEPYLFRHALDHAAAVGRIADILTDPAFLLHPMAAEPMAELDPAQHRVLELLAGIRPAGGPVSRDALALAAARHGLPRSPSPDCWLMPSLTVRRCSRAHGRCTGRADGDGLINEDGVPVGHRAPMTSAGRSGLQCHTVSNTVVTMASKQVTFTMDEELLAWFEQKAAQTGAKLSPTIAKAARNWMLWEDAARLA
ncbi:MAG: hypothetical protein ACRDTA_22445, partial [Pseudonocardiaceae bacterium]